MFDTRSDRPAARRGVSRAEAIVFLALWCLLALVGGATRAHCLDLGGECSPSAAAPAGPCHDQAPDGDRGPGCGSCVDILVPDDAAAGCSRPGSDLRAPAAAHSVDAAARSLIPGQGAVAAAASPLTAASPQSPFLRATVLRI